MRANFLGNNAAYDIEEGQILYKFFIGKLLNIVGNRNQNLSKRGTETTTNHFGSTTLYYI
jgi:hypothetical protein